MQASEQVVAGPTGEATWVDQQGRAWTVWLGSSGSSLLPDVDGTYSVEYDQADDLDGPSKQYGLYAGGVARTDENGDVWLGGTRLSTGGKFPARSIFGSAWISDLNGNIYHVSKGALRQVKNNGAKVLPGIELGSVFVDADGRLFHAGDSITDITNMQVPSAILPLTPNQYKIDLPQGNFFGTDSNGNLISFDCGNDATAYCAYSSKHTTGIKGLPKGILYPYSGLVIADGNGTLYAVNHSENKRLPDVPGIAPGTFAAYYGINPDQPPTLIISNGEGQVYGIKYGLSWNRTTAGHLENFIAQQKNFIAIAGPTNKLGVALTEKSDGSLQLIDAKSDGAGNTILSARTVLPSMKTANETYVACVPQTGDPAASIRQRVPLMVGALLLIASLGARSIKRLERQRI